MNQGILRLKISQEMPIQYEIVQTYIYGEIEYVILSSEQEEFLVVRKPLLTERYQQFKESSLLILENAFYIVLHARVQSLEIASKMVENISRFLERKEEHHG